MGAGKLNDQGLNLTYEYMDLWWEVESCFPNFKNKISLLNQFKNERKLEEFRKVLTKELHDMGNQSKTRGWSEKLLTIIKNLEGGIMGYENSCIDFFVNKGYSTITEDFVNEVNEFDPQMDIYDVFQAIRNVWIMNSIQILLDIEVVLSPSVFSYSMLYPYSDNYLDSADIKMEEKILFNEGFRRCLQGESPVATNENEKKIYELVHRIEEEFPRDSYREVFEALLAIHGAQEKSLLQQRGTSVPNEKNVIGITFEKGGTSVLADGYLVKGRLSEEEASFMFGYGVFLQLIDDLQDVEEDFKNGHMTLFSQILHKWPLDQLTNKLFGFIDEILINKMTFASEDAIKLRDVIHESCKIMIFEAISKNKKFFSRKYVKEIEKYSMLRFRYYKKLKKKFQRSFTSQDLHKICNGLAKKPKEEMAIALE